MTKPDPRAMKARLRKREAELQRLIRQMKVDKLNSSPVYRTLEEELENLKHHLDGQEEK